jgi:hypothetical protein
MSLDTIHLPRRNNALTLPGNQRSASLSVPALVKTPGESKVFNFNFGDYPEIRDLGQTLTGTPSVSSVPTGITLGSPSIAGNVVLCRISGGMDATDYTLTISCGTSDGASIIQGVVQMQVRSLP